MRKLKNDFKTQNKNQEAYYDLFEDYGLIESSFAQQYGIRLRIENDMTWDEFSTLLSGLNADTPLGSIVTIRSEKDPKKIKEFSAEQKRIRNEYINRKNKKLKSDKLDDSQLTELRGIEAAFKAMAISQ